MNKEKIFKQMRLDAVCFFLAILSPSIFATGLEYSQTEKVNTLTFSQENPETITIPLQISPVQVDAPTRRVDLLPSQHDLGENHPHFSSLSGFPADLNDYPILNFKTQDANNLLRGIDLELGAKDKGNLNTLVHIGQPSMFPDMVDEKIDFHSVAFAPKGRLYSLKRKVGLGGGEQWRYTLQNVALSEIAKGVVSASFVPGSDLVLTRAFNSLDIEKSPWLNYEYTLPKVGVWAMQINAKVDIGGVNRDVLLLSEPFKGEGKQKILLNMYDLLHKADPTAKKGMLKDLVIHFILDSASDAAKDIQIDLGQMEFYRVRQDAQQDKTNKYLIVSDHTKPIALAEKLTQLGYKGELIAQHGSLVTSDLISKLETNKMPEINIQAAYSEKIPKLFVGEAQYLNDLSDSELTAVLDQKLFLEKNVLWQVKQSEEIHLNQAALASTNLDEFQLMKYSPNVSLGSNSYIKVDYEFAGDRQVPIYITLSGADRKGKVVAVDRLLINHKPIKIAEMNLKQVMFSLKGIDFNTPLPNKFSVKNIQISEIKKSTTYKEKLSIDRVLLEKDIHSIDSDTAPTSKIVWKAASEIINFQVLGNEALQTIKSYELNRSLVGNSFIRLDMVPSGDQQFFLKIKGKSKDGRTEEKLIPLSNHCSVRIEEMELQGVDVVVRSTQSSGPQKVAINKLEVGIDEDSSQKLIWSMPSQFHDVSVLGSADVQTAKTFKVGKKISGGAMLDYALELTSGPPMSYLFRIRGQNELGAFERLVPLALRGSLPLPEMYLSSLDFLTVGGDGALISTIQLKRLSLRAGDADNQQLILPMNTKLTFNEITNGSKLINLPQTFSEKGEHTLEYSGSEDFDVRIDPAFMKIHQQQSLTTVPTSVPHHSVLKYLGGFIVAVLLYLVTCKYLPSLLPVANYPRLYASGFWVITFALLIAAYYMAFKSGGQDGFSWGGLILVATFGFAVRWKVRPLLARRWSYFADRYSAPYFMLFLVLLIFCVALLMFKLDLVAEKLAVIGYFLLIAGVVIEFVQFSKEASDNADA